MICHYDSRSILEERNCQPQVLYQMKDISFGIEMKGKSGHFSDGGKQNLSLGAWTDAILETKRKQ